MARGAGGVRSARSVAPAPPGGPSPVEGHRRGEVKPQPRGAHVVAADGRGVGDEAAVGVVVRDLPGGWRGWGVEGGVGGWG